MIVRLVSVLIIEHYSWQIFYGCTMLDFEQEHYDSLRTEFSSEVDLLAKIDHRNLVKLLGYLDKGDERIIITEYVPNGTLREHLDGKAHLVYNIWLMYHSAA